MTIQELQASIVPQRTALLLGAGSSIPSGAPSGAGLAHKLWKDLTQGANQSDDLVETASILERTFTRKPVVDCIISALESLRPNSGLLALPAFGWKAIYTTNFDRLIELAFSQCGLKLNVIRSNFDATSHESREITTLYKMHGCITQDRSRGQQASMILTEQDYDEFSKFRQSMYTLLAASFMNGDVIVIGQSLRDRHLLELVKDVLRARSEGTPGRVFVVVYDRDDLRAPLLEDRGARIVFCDLDHFVHAFAEGFTFQEPEDIAVSTIIPLALRGSVSNVSTEKTLDSNVSKMFNGAPATYADIRDNATFERAAFPAAMHALTDAQKVIVTVTGAAGVGKTTFARQVALWADGTRWQCYEHKKDYPLRRQPWTGVEKKQREDGQKGVLIVDESTRYFRQINSLVDYLASLEEPALRLIATANSSQWVPRLKTASIYKRGLQIELQTLENIEINSLLELLQNNPRISDLVKPDFKNLSRTTQSNRLRQKCSADMFVCLKNIFESESLDTILLTEFSELDEIYQEYYRYLAALESVGTKVHRHLLIRLLDLPADSVSTILNNLAGIVDEYDIRPNDGVYGWATRHIVIARKITEYKFSEWNELADLFVKIVDKLNPLEPVELHSIRDICDTEHGIGKLPDIEMRKTLYGRLTRLAPAERIPWHRLIREYLDNDDIEEVEFVIKNAIEMVGRDSPIDRYRVRLLLKRAQLTPSIQEKDRLALERKAYDLALKIVEKYPRDRYVYRTLCDVAVSLINRGIAAQILDEAIGVMRAGWEKILDPEMQRDLRRYEDLRARMG